MTTQMPPRCKAISAAKTLISQGCRFVGQNAVQLHGGIGVTHELNTSHYFKRLTMISVTFGDADWHWGVTATLLAAALVGRGGRSRDGAPRNRGILCR